MPILVSKEKSWEEISLVSKIEKTFSREIKLGNTSNELVSYYDLLSLLKIGIIYKKVVLHKFNEKITFIYYGCNYVIENEENISDRFEEYLCDCDADSSKFEKNIQLIDNKWWNIWLVLHKCVVVRVSKDLIEIIILLVIAIILILVYVIYVVIDERNKWNKRKFFNYKIYYEVDYSLYMDMVKKMKKVFFKKRLELIGLSVLVFLRRLFIWNKK